MTSLVVPPVAPAPVRRATVYRVSAFIGTQRFHSWVVEGIGEAMRRARYLDGRYDAVEITGDGGVLVASWARVGK